MTIIQIGANDGKDHVFDYVSEHKELIDRLVLIDANPHCIPVLTETYKDYSKAEIYNFAVVPFEIPIGHDTTVELLIPTNNSISSHSSLMSSHMEKHGHSALERVEVQAKNINSVLKEFSNGIIDRLYIDVEGYDVDIINSIDFTAVDIKYLCFEFIHADGPQSFRGPKLDACKQLLTNLGYTLTTVEYNIIAQK